MAPSVISCRMRMKSLVLVAILAAGCKAEDKAAPPPTPVVVHDAAGTGTATGTAVTDAAAAGPAFPLATGETLRPGPEGSNLVEWKVADGTVIQLGIVATGKDNKGAEKGVVRAYSDGKGHDLETYTLDPTCEHWATLKVLPNGRALFRFGHKGQATSRRGVVLVWNAADKRADVAKRWRGSSDADPAWF